MRRTLFLLLALGAITLAAVQQTKLTKRMTVRERLLRQGGDAWTEYVKRKEAMRISSRSSHKFADFDDNEYTGNITIGSPGQSFRVILDTRSADLWVADSSRSVNRAGNCDSFWCSGFFCAEFCEDQSCCGSKKSLKAVANRAGNCDNFYCFGFLCMEFCDDKSCCSVRKDKQSKGILKLKNVVRSKQNKFDSRRSLSYAKDGRPWQIQYGTGSVSGFLGVDTITLGDDPANILIVPKITFGQATAVVDFPRDETVDGVLGLAFLSRFNSNVKPVFQQAIDQKLMEQPLFTVWLNQDENENGGIFTWGAVDSTHCGAVLGYQSLSSSTDYQFTLSGASIGSFTINKKFEVISDAGTSFLAAPQDVTDKIATAAGGVYRRDWDLYTVDCNARAPDLTLTVGSLQLVLKSNNMIVKIDDSTCVISIHSYDSLGFGASWVLGEPFMRHYCNIYDMGNKRIGFAPSL